MTEGSEDGGAEGSFLERLELAPVFECIRRVHALGDSGTLIVRSGDERRNILFEHGQIVMATSSVVGERIGEHLVGQGLLSQRDMEEYLGRSTSGEPFGALLIRFGVISRAALLTHLRDLVLRIVSGTTSLKEGTAAFQPGVFPVPASAFLSFSNPTFLLDVVRRCSSKGILERTVELAGTKFDWVSGCQEAFPLTLAPAEYYVISRFEGKSIDVASAEKVVPDKLLVLRTIVALLLAGWLVPHVERTEAELEHDRNDLDPGTRSLLDLVEKMEGMSYYDLLGIPTGATQAELKKRWEELRAHYESFTSPPQAWLYSRRILIKLDEAFSILGDPERRKLHDQVLRKSGSQTTMEGSTHEMFQRRELQKKIARTGHEKAKVLVENGDYYGAIQLLEQAVAFDPENADYAWLLAMCQLKNPKWIHEAVETLQKVVSIDPSRSEAWIELARIYMQRKMFKRAASCYSEALKYDKESQEASQGLKKARSSVGGVD